MDYAQSAFSLIPVWAAVGHTRSRSQQLFLVNGASKMGLDGNEELCCAEGIASRMTESRSWIWSQEQLMD